MFGQLEDFALIRGEISKSISHLHHLASELHPRILQVEGLEAALRSLLERVTSTRDTPPSRLEYRLEGEPPTHIGSTLYRILEEALTNARKYGGAARVTVSLEDQGGGLLMRIEDDGTGFQELIRASSRERIGLLSMRERAEAAGGFVRIESMPGSGTNVECWLPHPGSLSLDEARVVRPADPSTGTVTSWRARTSPTPAERRSGDLSPRELEVAELLALGHTNAEVAAILHLSVRTIEHHRSRVFGKLGVHSRAELVRRLRERSHPSPDAEHRAGPQQPGGE